MNRLIRMAIARPVTVSMFMVAVILFGLVSVDRLALNLLPDISYPSLTIQTDYPDAAPEEVESLITRPIEEAVSVVSGLTRLSSISRSGQSEVILEFAWDTNMDLASLEVREKLDLVALPRDAEKPILLRFDPSYDPIMRLRLYGDMSLSRLRYVAEKELKKDLEATEGVAAVKVIGGLQEQIHIEIDEKRLAELGIPIAEVTAVLAEENLNQATGSLYDLDANYMVRLLNRFRSVDDIKRIVIRDEAGRRVLLSDVARVWRGTKERDVIARLNGRESVELAIYKEGDANTVTVAHAVQEKLHDLKGANLFPAGVQYEVVFNQAEFIQRAVSNVLWAAIIGGVLATFVLFVFLRDLRSTLTIGFTIPVSIMATFALMYQTDITLNIMSLGGVALGVGMLVDNSIVVLESVHRYKRTGRPLTEAVFLGTKEVATAITASTLTTVAVFLPLIFVEGIAGQLFKDQALTITYSLLASLLVALTLIPMILAWRTKSWNATLTETPTATPAEEDPEKRGRLRSVFHAVRRAFGAAGRFFFVDMTVVILTDVRRLTRGAGRGVLKPFYPLLRWFDASFQTLNRHYPRLLTWSLDNKSPVIAAVLILTALTVVISLRLGTELIPPLTQGEFVFEMKLPEGTPLERTDRIVRDIERQLLDERAYPEIATVFTSIGGSAQNQFARTAHQEHEAQLYVVLKNKHDKQIETNVIERIRDQLRDYPEMTYTFSRPTLFSFRTPIEVEVYAYDLKSLRATAELVADRLRRIDGLTDIKTSTQPGSPEIHVIFDRERLARLGLDETRITATLRNKIRGDVATRYREEDRQIDILVRADEADRRTIEDIKNLIVNVSSIRGDNTPDTLARASEVPIPIRLGSIADVVTARGPSEIRRIRSQRAAIISANVSGRDLGSVSQEIRAELRQLRREIPASATIQLGGQNEELVASYRSLLFALALAVFLVYLVMASQFESLIHPFIIMFTVPLGLIGVILSLFLTHTPISVVVFLGVIVLAGIVVNNAIILIDYTNQLRRRGIPKREALLRAGQVRLRPILMTTTTTVLGLAPMALGWGQGAEIRAPMAITVMGGLLFSTLLTLILIPVVYELVDRKVFAADERAALESTTAPASEFDGHWQPGMGD